MKKLIFLIGYLLILAPNAFSEGNWESQGHIFSNVHAWQKGNEVTISGRVSSGPARNPLEAIIYVINDEGKSHSSYIKVPKYSGKGELFESKFYSYKKYKWWNILKISVTGKSMPGPSQLSQIEQTWNIYKNEISEIENYTETTSKK